MKTAALEWQDDVRFALLVNVRPGQQTRLLGVALGDPDVFEPTPGGMGRNWTLVAVSPMRGAVAISTDATLADLTRDGSVTGEMIGGFTDPGLARLELATLDFAALRDSDEIWSAAGERARPEGASLALLNPAGLGVGPLAGEETLQPLLVYQLFSAQPGTQLFAFFDALTGRLLLDSSSP